MTLCFYIDGRELDMPASDIGLCYTLILEDPDTLERHTFSRTARLLHGRITTYFVETGMWRGAAFRIRVEKALEKKYPSEKVGT